MTNASENHGFPWPERTSGNLRIIEWCRGALPSSPFGLRRGELVVARRLVRRRLGGSGSLGESGTAPQSFAIPNRATRASRLHLRVDGTIFSRPHSTASTRLGDEPDENVTARRCR